MVRCFSHQNKMMLWTLVLALSVCLTSGFTLEEQMQQLKDNYIELKEDFSAKVGKLEAMLELKNFQQEILAAKVARLEELELKVQQQQSIINSLQEKIGHTSSTKSKTLPSSVEKLLIPDITPVAVTGMPKSCADLRYLGHTANGLYLIMGTEKVETVFCDFKYLPSDPSFQTWIGYVDVKSLPTYFEVQKTNNFNTTRTPMPYEREVINVGRAMNMSSGIFTAPRAGIYYLSFSGLATFPASPSLLRVTLALIVNGSSNTLGWAEEVTADGGDRELCNLQTTIPLRAGDQVWIEATSVSPGAAVFAGPFTGFTGWLLEEDISQSLKVA